MWHCPHCGTPQAETARCWVCRRSSTICSTCRHFRRAVTAGLGYCGLDRTRRPLRGDEIRGCWTGRPSGETAAAPAAPAPVPPARLRGFVPLDAFELTAGPSEPPTTAPVPQPVVLDAFDRVTLFDLDA